MSALLPPSPSTPTPPPPNMVELYTIILYVFLGVHLIVTLLKATVIGFLTTEWTKPSSIFQSAYFIILNFGYWGDLLFSICWMTGHLTHYSDTNPLLPVFLLLQWHFQFLLGFWNSMLSFNQCTAFAFPFLHSKLWQGKPKISAILVLLLLFPFLIDGYSFREISCKLFYFFQPRCVDTYRETHLVMAIVNIVFGSLSLFLVVFGVFMAPKSVKRSAKSRMERRLIVQTALSSMLLIFNFVALAFAAIFCEFAWQLGLLAYLLYLIQYYPPIIALFVISPAFRQKYGDFYGLTKFFHKNNKCGTDDGVRIFKTIP